MLNFNEKSIKDIRFFLQRIQDRIYTPVASLSVTGFITPEPVPFAEREHGTRHIFIPGERWGKLWDCAWVNVTGKIPEDVQGNSLVMLFDCGGEALIVDESGTPLRGLTNVDSTFERSLGLPGKTVWPLSSCAGRSKSVDLWLDLACNDLFGEQRRGVLEKACIAVCNEPLRDLYYDAWVLFDLLQCLEENTPRAKRLLVCLERALNQLTDEREATIAQCRRLLATELARKGGDAPLSITGIGHAHIDLAWLWPIRETKRKGARTFATAIELLARYPDYYFGASQPQLFQWIKEDYPQLYAKVKNEVAAGRFEIQGDMWVEADTNIPSGESLVRQFLYGRKFFRREFSQVTGMLWLPDVFGYNANLPQIMKKSGVDYFLTQKLSWNEHNKFPHHTFNWEGIDGSTVLAHMLPEETYNSPAAPRSIKLIEQNYQEAGVCDSALMLFGIGDGGGGPGPEHLERLMRMKDLQGISPVTQGKAIDFFRHIARHQVDYPRYKGELYLEKHQGTLTTQAQNKFYNRKMEQALRNLEFAASREYFYGDMDYPADDIQTLWEETLLYQFHDILPGSSIKRVYDESVARYKSMLARIETLTQACLAAFAAYTPAGPDQLIVHNTTGFARSAWLQVPGGVKQLTIPPFGYALLDAGSPQCPPMLVAENQRLENALLCVWFNDDGTIGQIDDKAAGRSLLKPGTCANRLAVYEDIGGDCWDMNITWRNRQPQAFILTEVKAYLDGATAIVEQHYQYGYSALVQKITLTADSKRLDFHTRLDWQEDLKMLRTAFEVDIRSDVVTCDIQFGKIQRAARMNTVYDAAQFEICAHKWIDYSERDYGVALMNDCKYGHYAKNGVLDLHLVRAQNHPGIHADRGEHVFSYALFPHCGDEVEGKVNREATLFNNPLIIAASDGETKKDAQKPVSFIACDSAHICVETIKKAEERAALAIRLYEFDGCHATAQLTLPATVARCVLTNLMEEGDEAVPVTDGKITLVFTPFEIKTVLLYSD